MLAPMLVRVWDPVVRIGHWTLVAAFAVAYLTEDDLLSVHVWAGYVIGIILVIRLAWGFVGPPLCAIHRLRPRAGRGLGLFA